MDNNNTNASFEAGNRKIFTIYSGGTGGRIFGFILACLGAALFLSWIYLLFVAGMEGGTGGKIGISLILVVPGTLLLLAGFNAGFGRHVVILDRNLGTITVGYECILRFKESVYKTADYAGIGVHQEVQRRGTFYHIALFVDARNHISVCETSGQWRSLAIARDMADFLCLSFIDEKTGASESLEKQ